MTAVLERLYVPEPELLVVDDVATEVLVETVQEMLVETEQEVLETTAPELLIEQVETLEVLDVEPEVVEILTEGMQGPPGIQGLQGPPGANGAGQVQFPFAWGDATPAVVAVATGGKLVYGVVMHITTAFNGVGAELSVGDAGNLSRLMTAAQNNPGESATYEVAPNIRYGADTTVLLTINAGAGASAGAGLLTLFIEQ